MIIKKLVLHNFGVYAGTNEFAFHGEKPIVLIGGLNGRGKTTFLEAILVCLYGAASGSYIESNYQSYGQYLKSYVNTFDGTLHTYLELEFAHNYEGNDQYRVRKEWDGNNQRIREKTEVYKNQEFNSFLTENWSMFIENILPSALSSFFFFDGEKIAELAVEESNSQMKDSIRAMLGISVLNTLQKDLNRVLSRAGKNSSSSDILKTLERVRSNRNFAKDALNLIDSKIADLDYKLGILNQELEKETQNYEIKGGLIANQKSKLMQERADLQAKLAGIKNSLIELSASSLPLTLVEPLLQDILFQSEKEQESKLAKLTEQRVQNLCREYSAQFTSARSVASFLDYVKKECHPKTEKTIYDLPEHAIYSIKQLIYGGLVQVKSESKKLRSKQFNLQTKLNDIDRYLSVDTNDQELKGLYEKISEIELKILDIKSQLNQLNKERATLNGQLRSAEAEFKKTAEQVVDQLELADDNERLIKYLHISDKIIDEYRIRLQRRKTAVLGETMTSCYKILANKTSLIDHIYMDSTSLDLHYYNKLNEEIEKNRLSAGEKQLMVISLLWALAICSQKKLPVIIDTPLSRLDSLHRESIITKYFPHASDQTIILSTDSEIGVHEYQLISEHVDDEFTLSYDDEEKRTTIKKGYFFGEGVHHDC